MWKTTRIEQFQCPYSYLPRSTGHSWRLRKQSGTRWPPLQWNINFGNDLNVLVVFFRHECANAYRDGNEHPALFRRKLCLFQQPNVLQACQSARLGIAVAFNHLKVVRLSNLNIWKVTEKSQLVDFVGERWRLEKFLPKSNNNSFSPNAVIFAFSRQVPSHLLPWLEPSGCIVLGTSATDDQSYAQRHKYWNRSILEREYGWVSVDFTSRTFSLESTLNCSDLLFYIRSGMVECVLQVDDDMAYLPPHLCEICNKCYSKVCFPSNFSHILSTIRFLII